MDKEWNAQKMLDLYIHDYLIRKNMNATAGILAREAEIEPKDVALNPPDGFLSEWWYLFWDVYCARVAALKAKREHRGREQASSSQPPQDAAGAGSMPPNIMPPNAMPPVPLMPAEFRFMQQNMIPAMQGQGLPDMLQAVNPATIQRPADMASLMQSTLPMMMNNADQNPKLQAVNRATMQMPADMASLMQSTLPMMMNNVDLNPNSFGAAPGPESNMMQDQIMRELLMREQQHLRLPPMDIGPNMNAFNVGQFAHGLASSSSGSSRQRKANNKRQLSVAREINLGSGSRRSTPPGLPIRAPEILHRHMDVDTGRRKVPKFPQDGSFLSRFGYEQKQSLGSSSCCRADNQPELAAQASTELVVSGALESSTQMVSPILLGDSSNGKGRQIGQNTEIEITDADIESFFSTEEAPQDMSISPTNTSPTCSLAQKQQEQQEFPFAIVRSIHPTNKKLSCCDFSSQGKFLAAAGHEKKVFIWNLKQSTRQIFQGHGHLISDVRFKPNSNIFATSSFDRTVKIWDAAANTRKPLFNLMGHAEQVTSLDFHPRKTNLLCSCDLNDEIKFWNIKDAGCLHTLKGAKKQVRFQPRQGKLLAAALGNVISLIDVETGVTQCRLEGHEKDVTSICWDACGEYLVSVSQESTRIWSLVASGKCLHEFHSGGRDFSSCTFHPGYTQVVAVGSYKSIYIWNPTMGNKTWTYPAHHGIVSAMTNALETNRIASVSHDQWVKLWK